MRIIFWLSVLSSLCAFLLTVFCFIQISVVKQPTTTALTIIDNGFIKRSAFSTEQIKNLNSTLGTIRWNDQVFRATHANLWPASVLGFLFLAVSNLGIAVLVSKRIYKSNNSKADNVTS